jgi:spore coat protein U-like protein
MNRFRFSLCLLPALCIAGTSAFAANNSCSFEATGGFSLSFGSLDPSNAVTVTAPVAAASLNSANAGDCNPSNQTMTISADNGLYASGGTRRMRNAAGDFIAYSLSSMPLTMSRPGNNRYVTVTFNGTVLGTAYQDASAGEYSDTVTISVNP